MTNRWVTTHSTTTAGERSETPFSALPLPSSSVRHALRVLTLTCPRLGERVYGEGKYLHLVPVEADRLVVVDGGLVAGVLGQLGPGVQEDLGTHLAAGHLLDHPTHGVG